MFLTDSSNRSIGLELKEIEDNINQAPKISISPQFDRDKAIQYYQDEIKVEPLNYWLWYNLCGLLVTRGDIDEAISACQIGIEKFPKNFSPILHLINLYEAKGDYRQAIKSYRQFLDLDAVSLRLAFETGNTLMTTTSYEIELKEFLKQ
jgi:tetratricopeptide (TPR) repeat protein